MVVFLKELLQTFHPANLAKFCGQSFKSGVLFFSKMLFLSFFLMALLYIPTFVNLPSYFGQQMLKFNSLSITSNFSTMAPVYFPERDSWLVVDTTGMHGKLKQETFLVTKNNLKYKFFGKEFELTDKDFADVMSNKSSFSVLLSSIAVLIIPALFFWLYVFLWIKYFGLSLLLSFVFFSLFDLTHFRKKWLQFFNIAVYTAIVPILLEILSVLFSTQYLVPIIQSAGFNVFLLPLIVHCILIGVFGFVLHYVGGRGSAHS